MNVMLHKCGSSRGSDMIVEDRRELLTVSLMAALVWAAKDTDGANDCGVSELCHNIIDALDAEWQIRLSDAEKEQLILLFEQSFLQGGFEGVPLNSRV